MFPCPRSRLRIWSREIGSAVRVPSRVSLLISIVSLNLVLTYESQSCLWSAEQGKLMFPCPRSRLRIWSREIGSAVRIPSRVSLLTSIVSLNLVLTYEIPPEFCGGVQDSRESTRD